ncbi:uncharacterized protein BJ212DRAFT_1299089 [Suillus subaureus]|uniref:Uncharacterized protein n=1 Tax=Suillus subaureus TaxID=48587 RepID=A0A9P7JE65_9AGAM|nr:uncharacterized protein BJ212DRAFT_1299089 [Suillus subaureus]KAG1817536.1 hypothetical protein BJ212DRAFT_1299089 [Suillus subaureus]
MTLAVKLEIRSPWFGHIEDCTDVSCIFADTMIQCFGERMGSLEFTVWFTAFCVIGAMLGFLAAIFANFKTSTFLVVLNIVMLSIVCKVTHTGQIISHYAAS